jgi:GxxExxY protein
MNEQTPDLSGRVIGAAIRGHGELRPGFLEKVYEEALSAELTALGIRFERQFPIQVKYRAKVLAEHRLDLIVERDIVLELKTAAGFDPTHSATLRSYLKASNCDLGLLLNFAATTLQIKRVGREWHSRAN